MMRNRAIPFFATSVCVVLCVGLTLDASLSQEITTRNDLMPQSGAPQPFVAPLNASASASDHAIPPAAESLPPRELWSAKVITRPNPLWAIPLASLQATRERPMFSPSRRPPAQAVLQVPQALQPPPPVVETQSLLLDLVGTVTAEDESVAVFRDERSKDIIRLRLGEGHSGWTLTTVRAREVTLERDRETKILTIPSPPSN